MSEQALLDELAGVADAPEATPEADAPPKVETITPEQLAAANDAAAKAQTELEQLKANLAEQIKQLRAERQADKVEAAAPAPPKAPDFMVDPEGNFRFQLAQKEEEFTKALNEMRTKSEEERNVIAQRLFQTQIGQAEIQFTNANPDYYAALDHVRQIRAKELTLVGVPAADIPKILSNEELGLGVQAINTGKHPAQVAYERAKLLGYSPKSDTQKGADALAPDPEAERRARAERAQSMGGGGTPDLDSLLNADEDVFSAAFQELLGAKLR